MEYTVQQLAKLSGVSKRTLHYYDEIDLLKPKAIRSNGYRIYGSEEVTRLQQILFYLHSQKLSYFFLLQKILIYI